MKKILYLLLITLILSGCHGMENGEKEESNDKVDGTTIYNGIITVGKTKNEMILNEEGYEGIPLVEYANQLAHISSSPSGKASIHIDNDPQVRVYLWGTEVPLESNSFSLPYETGLYVYNIEANWPNEEANFVTVIEVPYEFKRVKREKEPDNPNAWIPSPNGEKQVMIEGLEEFEATGTIVLKELSSKTMANIDFNHGSQWTAKKIEWYDDNSVLTTIGLVHGTVTRGGDLYHLNLNTLELTPIIELPVKEEIVNFSIEGNQLSYEVHIYEDDQMSKGYMEARTLDLSTIKEKLKKPFTVEERQSEGYKSIKEVVKSDEVKTVVKIIENAEWEENIKMDMALPPEYRFSLGSFNYAIWVTPNRDRLEIIAEGQAKYIKLPIKESKILYKIITEKEL